MSKMAPDDSLDWTIFDRLSAGDASPEDRARLDEWICANPSRKVFWLAFQDIKARNTDIPRSWDTQRLLNRLSDRTVTAGAPGLLRVRPASGRFPVSVLSAGWFKVRQKVSKEWVTPRVFWPATVGLTLVVALTLFGWMGGASQVMRRVDSSTLVYETGGGEMQSFLLPDGSVVALGESSRLEVPKDLRSGQPVRLQGEAAFSVLHQPDGAFTVIVPGTQVRVLGTTFMVRRYSADTAALVVVHEGRVAVRSAEGRVVVLSAARLAVVSRGALHEAPERELTHLISEREMNPLTLLYSVAALAVTSPTMPASPSDSVHAPPPPVLNDSILLGWHLALVHFYDTLLVHPDLQSMAGVTPMLSVGPFNVHNRFDECPLWNREDPRFTAPQLKQAGLVSFPADSVMQTISQTPALAGAIQSALLTPGEFVAITSAIGQAHCAKHYFHDLATYHNRYDEEGDDSVRKSLLDSNSVLNKNFAFIYANYKENKSMRWARVEDGGLRLWGKYDGWKLRMKSDTRKPDPDWYPKDKRFENLFNEDMLGLRGILDPKTGQELPIPHKK